MEKNIGINIHTLPLVTVGAVPCRSPHDSEVVGIFDLPDTGWPGADAVADASLAGCNQRLLSLGSGDQDVELTALAPTEESWADDRSVLCIAQPADGQPVRGSLAVPGACCLTRRPRR